LENIRKCVAGGFQQVVLVAADRKILNLSKALAPTAFTDEDCKRLSFFTPEEFLTFLEEKEAEFASKDQTVRGYKVKVQYHALGEAEKKARKKAVAQTVLQALRRMKDK
jgi:hypothetical protein